MAGRRAAAIAVALALSGCASGGGGGGRMRPPMAVGTTAQIDALVRRALELDAAGERSADSLYAPEAIVVANARVRFAAPRFAGVSYGGQVSIAAATVTLQGGFAWVMVDYRWINPERRLAETGRATFVCEERAGAWRIIHAHSSQTLPWDR